MTPPPADGGATDSDRAKEAAGLGVVGVDAAILAPGVDGAAGDLGGVVEVVGRVQVLLEAPRAGVEEVEHSRVVDLGDVVFHGVPLSFLL